MDSSFDSSVGLRAPPAEMALWQTTPALLHAGFGCDPDVAVAALVTGPGGRFLALDAHGGGETALALVSRGAMHVAAVPLLDPEGASSILALKVAALRHLDRAEYLRFVGLWRSTRAHRAALYGTLELQLTPRHRLFWDRHRDVLLRGLFAGEADVAQGRLLRNLLRTHLPKAAYRTILYAGREARVAAFEQHIAGRRFWENALRMCAVRGQFRICVDGEASPLTCDDPMVALRRLVEVGPAGCPVWVRAFANDTGVEGALPWHLSAQGYAALQANLDALTVELDPLMALTVHAPGTFDAYDLTRARAASLPDVFSRIAATTAAHARCGARILVTEHDAGALPLDAGLTRDAALTQYVAGCDRAPGGASRAVLRRA